MPRIRTIKPEAFTSPDMAALPLAARWTFVGLWTHVDDEGRAHADSRLLKGAIWPLDDDVTPADIDGYLDLLAAQEMVCRYLGDDGRELLHVVNWSEHQKVNKPTATKLCECPRHDLGLPTPSIHRQRSPQEPDRSAPVVLPEPEGSQTFGLPLGKERKGKEGKGRERTLVGASADERFAAFYLAYPRKVGREAAFRAWQKAVRRVDPEVIVAGAERFAADPNLPRERQYIPHPATWINGGRWADEPLPSRTDRQRPSNDEQIADLLARAEAMEGANGYHHAPLPIGGSQ